MGGECWTDWDWCSSLQCLLRDSGIQKYNLVYLAFGFDFSLSQWHCKLVCETKWFDSPQRWFSLNQHTVFMIFCFRDHVKVRYQLQTYTTVSYSLIPLLLQTWKMSFSLHHPNFMLNKIYPKKCVIFGNTKFVTKQQKLKIQ